MPSKIFTIGQMVRQQTVHIPNYGKCTLVDIQTEEERSLLYRFCFTAAKFGKYAKTVDCGALVAVEGTIAPSNFLKASPAEPSVLFVHGETFRVLQRPSRATLSLDNPTIPWSIPDSE